MNLLFVLLHSASFPRRWALQHQDYVLLTINWQNFIHVQDIGTLLSGYTIHAHSCPVLPDDPVSLTVVPVSVCCCFLLLECLLAISCQVVSCRRKMKEKRRKNWKSDKILQMYEMCQCDVHNPVHSDSSESYVLHEQTAFEIRQL